MQDRDLAELYQVTTGNLNKAVKRNIRRFPHLHPMTKKVIILNAKVIKKSQLSTKNNEIPTKMRLFPKNIITLLSHIYVSCNMFLGFGLDAWITIVTLVMVMSALILTQLRADLVFLSAVGVLFVTGVLNANEAFAGFISTPVLIIGVMCVVVAGLSSTGVIQRISRHVLGKPKGEIQALMRLTLPVVILSSFIVNSTVVMIFVGVVNMWARKLEIKASRLFIPMSYAAVMGGALLLFVTPSGLVVSGLYTLETGQTLNLFEPFLPALACLAAGMLAVFALRGLLPDRIGSETAFEKTGDYTLEMMVTSNNPHITQLPTYPLTTFRFLKMKNRFRLGGGWESTFLGREVNFCSTIIY